MTIVTLGIDLGKNLNSVVGLDAEGQVVLRRRVRRATLAELAGRLSLCTVAMEACCGAHHVGHLFAAKGHEVQLMSPEYVRPYIRAQKNDDNDAAGIAEAATRPTMRFVELKSQDRLDLQSLHRARSRLVAARKALVNQLRAILLERGHTFRQGRKVLEREIDPFLAEPPSDLSPLPEGSNTRVHGNLVQKKVLRRRDFYEDQDARISIMARAMPLRRIRLCTTEQSLTQPTCQRAGHTFLSVMASCRKKRLIIDVLAFTPRSSNKRRHSAASVMSGCSARTASRKARYGLSTEGRWPPVPTGIRSPVFR